ncbi:adenylate/guanylate cyclase domain-containing protein [Agrobacterium larrymoorei]|uniref:adenylate/guanylate cyclase domain-containing protein n=1 Tax=Agrobacterium larrymoorei TaxID=160699 RepID=UPI001571923C|nr:adenylate/guanylate cyclase domain-containing protein [Agrobacterium larrymoorei]NTJ43237.1 adenylate/guanylate cyclase domain-containing protein [Agrobacterium larrymoorei]
MAQFVSETTLRRVRLLSGLVMLSFVATHLSNHALALISVDTAEYGRMWFTLVWLNPISSIILYGSVLTHLILVLRSIYLRQTLRMPLREALQIIAGLMIPYLIIDHAGSIRLSRVLFGIDTSYEIVIYNYWIRNPQRGIWQSTALLVVWFHGCLGVFFWLRYRDWYKRVSPYLLTVAVLLPILALLGFSDAGRAMEYNPPPPHIRPTNQASVDTRVGTYTDIMKGLFGGSVLLVFAMRGVRSWRRRSSAIEVRYDHGALVRAPLGLSVLEASRLGGVSHFSACGGKGRCSTCRVRILGSDGPLPAPSSMESATLQRIHADSDVRLGCQLRPKHGLNVALLLASKQQADIPARDEPIRPGREEDIAVLFCDLRNFTAISEARLPYDMVFLLNRYFTVVGQAVEQAGGRLDKFIGDGAMALFGLEGNKETASRDAMKAAAHILRSIEELNEELENQFAVRFRIVIGIHAGPSIVGIMGYGAAKNLTAIGDTVNVASRLETAAKEFGTSIVISEPAIIQSGQDTGSLQSRTIPIRGRSSEMKVFLISEEESRRFL